MLFISVYERCISGESRKVIRYNLIEHLHEGVPKYGINVSTKTSCFYEEDSITDISEDKSLVIKLMDYLYENCVDVIHFKDVINDYILKCENTP